MRALRALVHAIRRYAPRTIALGAIILGAHYAVRHYSMVDTPEGWRYVIVGIVATLLVALAAIDRALHLKGLLLDAEEALEIARQRTESGQVAILRRALDEKDGMLAALKAQLPARSRAQTFADAEAMFERLFSKFKDGQEAQRLREECADLQKDLGHALTLVEHLDQGLSRYRSALAGEVADRSLVEGRPKLGVVPVVVATPPAEETGGVPAAVAEPPGEPPAA